MAPSRSNSRRRKRGIARWYSPQVVVVQHLCLSRIDLLQEGILLPVLVHLSLSLHAPIPQTGLGRTSRLAFKAICSFKLALRVVSWSVTTCVTASRRVLHSLCRASNCSLKPVTVERPVALQLHLELLSSVIKLLLQRLNESPVSPIRGRRVPSLRLLQLYESLMVLLLVPLGVLLVLVSGLLSSEQKFPLSWATSPSATKLAYNTTISTRPGVGYHLGKVWNGHLEWSMEQSFMLKKLFFIWELIFGPNKCSIDSKVFVKKCTKELVQKYY